MIEIVSQTPFMKSALESALESRGFRMTGPRECIILEAPRMDHIAEQVCRIRLQEGVPLAILCPQVPDEAGTMGMALAMMRKAQPHSHGLFRFPFKPAALVRFIKTAEPLPRREAEELCRKTGIWLLVLERHLHDAKYVKPGRKRRDYLWSGFDFVPRGETEVRGRLCKMIENPQADLAEETLGLRRFLSELVGDSGRSGR